jgi:hypothetical protein
MRDSDEIEVAVPVKINGLPAHILLIHVVIVLLPLGALMLVASAVWPAARAKLGFLTPAVTLVALVFVPITTNAGHWLQDHLQGGQGRQDQLILRHASLGGHLLPWAIGIFVLAAAVWLLSRRVDLSWRTTRAPEPTAADGSATTTSAARPSGRPLPVWVTAIVAVLAIAVATGGIIELYRIGDSGSKAVWTGRTSG